MKRSTIYLSIAVVLMLCTMPALYYGAMLGATIGHFELFGVPAMVCVMASAWFMHRAEANL